MWLSHYLENEAKYESLQWTTGSGEDSGDTHGCGMHPVITLKGEILTDKGNGSKESPFEIFI